MRVIWKKITENQEEIKIIFTYILCKSYVGGDLVCDLINVFMIRDAWWLMQIKCINVLYISLIYYIAKNIYIFL